MLHSHEKDGTRPIEANTIDLFKQFLDDAQLMDVRLQGCKYTWVSNPRDGIVTRQKIDRFLANWEWKRLYPHAIATAMPIINTYHSPIILQPNPPLSSGVSFKYEAFWEEKAEYRDVVHTSWEGEGENENLGGDLNGAAIRVHRKLGKCKRNLMTSSRLLRMQARRFLG